MKTETQIAQENVKYITSEVKFQWRKECCKEHKSSCERWLEFLKELESHKVSEHRKYQSVCEFCIKITDLKQTIKLYSENGI